MLTQTLPSMLKGCAAFVSLRACRNWADLVKRARGKQLQPDEYNSGTFTISNLGMFGVDTFDAILPPGAQCLVFVWYKQEFWRGTHSRDKLLRCRISDSIMHHTVAAGVAGKDR
jgi:hypothetical protein